ncbi:DUF2913 family protein [Vibrio sp. JC009]|uniref:DUF2913 family protein n=1 Tax=Vibrio sp. JC009 TaxID=2912314 RepID=UPI0023B0F2F6|nr:DUF2913 family protein [Vibrio sp. JC009]WED23786.1 DUF2913 family protein [Vibrio sp. JC009]
MNIDTSTIKLESLSRLINHSMIKLYLDMAYSVRKLTIEQRNHCIVRFLKSAIKKSCYKPVKSSIRELIHYAKRPKANMEAKLNEMKQLLILTKATVDSDSDLFVFIGILTGIDQLSPVTTDAFIPDNCQVNYCYLENGFLVDNFDEHGSLKKEVSLIIPVVLEKKLESILISYGWNYLVTDFLDCITHQRYLISKNNR